MMKWQVGSTARVKRPSPQKGFGKAMIAMMDHHGDTDEAISLLWEPVAPQPLGDGSHSTNNIDFLVAPRISESNPHARGIDDRDHHENETTVPLNELLPLMEFESSSSEISKDIGVLKEQGDSLLRAGDASAAVSYYEAALQQSSQTVVTSIGSSIILKTKGGYLKVAEIDCIEKGETESSFSIDVTFVESGEEMEIPNSAVVLGILDSDGEERLQERILLNLSRCLHQLADIDEPKHRPAYLKGAIMACSLAIVLAEFHASSNKDDVDVTTKSKGTIQTALHLRAKAYILLSKWPHAKQDAKRLIKEGKQDQGKSLLDNIEKRKQVQAKKDKKLAKAVAKLVHNVTSTSTDGDNREQQTGGRSVSGVSEKNKESSNTDKVRQTGSGQQPNVSSTELSSKNTQQPLTTFLFAIAIIGVVVSFLVRKVVRTDAERTGE